MQWLLLEMPWVVEEIEFVRPLSFRRPLVQTRTRSFDPTRVAKRPFPSHAAPLPPWSILCDEEDRKFLKPVRPILAS